MRRSKRPGRRSAGSRLSSKLVAATVRTPERPNPSSSTSSWLIVWLYSRLAPPPAPAPAAVGGRARAERVDFVDEADRGLVFASLGVNAAHALRAHADEELHEIRARH